MKRISRGRRRPGPRSTPPGADGFSWESSVCSTVVSRLEQKQDVLIRGGPPEGLKALIRRIALGCTAAGTVVILSNNRDEWIDLCVESGYKINACHPPTGAYFGEAYDTVICDDGVTDFVVWATSPTVAISAAETPGVQVTSLRKEVRSIISHDGDSGNLVVKLQLD